MPVRHFERIMPMSKIDPRTSSDSHTESPLHVLVVDDEPVLREEIVEYLCMRGMNAEYVGSGAEALARLSAAPSIEAMLTDIKMPNMDGLTLAQLAIEQITEEHALEVVVITGHATVADAAAALRLRAVDFLTKPARLTAIATAVAKAGATARQRRAVWRQSQTDVRTLSDSIEALQTLQSQAEELKNQLNERSGATSLEAAARDAFLAVIGHELRTPLQPIIGFADLIENRLDRLSPEQVKTFAHDIRESGHRLNRTLARIVDMTALASKAAIAERVPHRVWTIAQSVAAGHAAALAARKQRLRIDVAIQDDVATDACWLVKLLSELVDNASRFAPVGAAIGLSVRHENGGTVFEVQDTGSGMTADELEIAKQPFKQVDMSPSRPYEGLGIGLAMAKDIAVLLGGTLILDSVKGSGTTVSVHLPDPDGTIR
jgi:signal transduction histidine kinase